MILFLAVVAVYTEPIEAITEPPWDFMEKIEWIQVIPMEELEKKLKQQNLRIMENQNDR
jgi:hypothetical protein